jgi:hypothetical protein
LVLLHVFFQAKAALDSIGAKYTVMELDARDDAAEIQVQNAIVTVLGYLHRTIMLHILKPKNMMRGETSLMRFVSDFFFLTASWVLLFLISFS